MTIHYKVGDATKPKLDEDEAALIVHCCNDIGVWGAGFTGALDTEFGYGPRDMYLNNSPRLGSFTFEVFDIDEPVEGLIGVANVVGQQGVVGPNSPTPIDYEALAVGLARLDEWLEYEFENWPVSIVMPRIGAGLAGGSWEKISRVIDLAMPFRDIIVYDLPGAVEGKDWNP